MSQRKQLVPVNCSLTIAGITIAVRLFPGEKLILTRSQNPLRRFISDHRGDLELKLCNILPGTSPVIKLKKNLFNSGSTWSLHQDKANNFVLIDDLGLDKNWEQLLVINPDFTHGELYCRIKNRGKGIAIDKLFTYPIDQVLMIQLLGQKRGIMVHSSGVKYRDKGLLFAGSSGKGKSTMSNLWRGVKKTEILNDDRIILKESRGIFTMHGTPWHGTAKYAHPGQEKLAGIFFLAHNKTNTLKKLSRLEANSRLISALFCPFWDKAGMRYSMGFVDKLVQKIPCYELGFAPEPKVINFVLKQI